MVENNKMKDISTVLKDDNNIFRTAKEEEKLNPMDIIMTKDNDIGIILVGLMSIPILKREYAINFNKDFEINNAENWQFFYEGYVIYNLTLEKHEIIPYSQVRKVSLSSVSQYIFSDAAAEKLNITLGLINLMKKCESNVVK
jgi:hypothetical protein